MRLSTIAVLLVLAKLSVLVAGDCRDTVGDGFSSGIIQQGGCYAVDSVTAYTECDDGCKETETTFIYYNGGYCSGLPRENYGSLTFSSVVNCPGKEDSCSVETSEGACLGCTLIDETPSAIVDCSNLETFQINDFEPLIFTYEHVFPWLISTDEICAHPSNEFGIPGVANPGPCDDLYPDDGGDTGGNNGGNSGGGACFSAMDTVNVLGKGVVGMSDLRLGDKVLVSSANTGGEENFEPIYSFAHYELAKEQNFIQLYTSSTNESPLEVTKEHLVFVVSGDKSAPQAIRADQVRKGDTLLRVTPGQVAPTLVSIVKIAEITRKGRIAPLTPSGKIVVNSLLASAYISLDDYLPMALRVSLWKGFSVDDDKLFHLLLSPYRMMCMGVSIAFGEQTQNLQNNSDDGIPALLVVYKLVTEFAIRQPYVFQVVFIWIPLLVVFGFLNLLEHIFGSSLAPTAVVLIVSGFYAWKCSVLDELKKHKFVA